MRTNFRVLALALLLVAATGDPVPAYSPGERWTAERLVRLSDALVFGKVVGFEVEVLHGRPFTQYRFAVREVHLDRESRISGEDEIRVCVPGGRYTDKRGINRKWRPLNAPELETGREYILFLKWRQGPDCYVAVGGEAGVFLVAEEGQVLDHDGNAVLDTGEDGFVAVPEKAKRAARAQQRLEAPPAGIVEDLSGVRRPAKVASGSAFDREYDEARVLRKDAFLLKVFGGRP